MISKKQSDSPTEVSSLRETLFLAPNFDYLSEEASQIASKEVIDFSKTAHDLSLSDAVLFSFPSYIYEKNTDEEFSIFTKDDSSRKKRTNSLEKPSRNKVNSNKTNSGSVTDEINSSEIDKSFTRRSGRNTETVDRKRNNKRRNEEGLSIPKNKRIYEWQFSELQYEFYSHDSQEKQSFNETVFPGKYRDDTRYDELLSARLNNTTIPVNGEDEKLSSTERRKGINRARTAVIERAQEKEEVGSFVEMCPLGDRVYNFYFRSHLVGYEGWQWLATLFYDKDCYKWTTDEVSLIPTRKSLLAPRWIMSKNRHE